MRAAGRREQGEYGEQTQALIVDLTQLEVFDFRNGVILHCAEASTTVRK